jgi:hypothetical protein
MLNSTNYTPKTFYDWTVPASTLPQPTEIPTSKKSRVALTESAAQKTFSSKTEVPANDQYPVRDRISIHQLLNPA